MTPTPINLFNSKNQDLSIIKIIMFTLSSLIYLKLFVFQTPV